MASFSPCSDLTTRALKWVAASDNAKNSDGRPAPYVAWGVSADSIAASYGAAYAADVRGPQWG